jgi:C4-dicarboxylate-specific signal transduction histidine kinase
MRADAPGGSRPAICRRRRCSRCWREISAQALRAGEVLRRIREFLRGESRREEVDLNDVVRRAIRFAEGEARRAEVQLALDLAPEPLQIQVDPIQIEQVLLNLVQNGFDVMATNNGTERILAIATAVSPPTPSR